MMPPRVLASGPKPCGGNYNFREKKKTKVWKGKIYKRFYTLSMVIETKVVIGWLKLQLKMWLVDLNYNFECD